MREEWIVHICRREEWQAAQVEGEYRTTSLEAEGFIHCSKPGQALGVANRYYRGVPDLVLLWIDPGRVTAEIRWEAVEGGEEYPHIYGGINVAAIQEITEFLPGVDGIFIQLPQL